jgi:RHS repeat-associated protein
LHQIFRFDKKGKWQNSNVLKKNIAYLSELLNDEGMFVNGLFSGARTSTDNFTAYINPYLVVSKGGNYTKHIYIGSQRIVSKLGDLDSYGQDPRRIAYAGSEVDGASIDFASKYKEAQQTVKDRYTDFGIEYRGEDNDDYVNGGGFCCDDSPILRSGAMGNGNDNPETFQYYYHSDHLGSTNLITNLDGEIVQHVEYVPFGEVFIEERNNTWNTPYLFNAKELDEETGLYYYGARYYDSRISVFLGVDPLWEKYPNVSSYAYCLNNPVKYIDPTGMGPNEWLKKLKSCFVDLKKWWNGDTNYTGSGWGHGARQELAEAIGIDNKASNVATVSVLSQLQFDEVMIAGSALEKIKTDPAMINRENALVELAKSDPNFGNNEFSFVSKAVVEFGGKRAPEDMWTQAKDPLNPDYADTWNVALNELTWLIRHASVESTVSVDKNGSITINNVLSDVFDLRPSSKRSSAYNTATNILGTFYHDIFGGNDQLKIKAIWESEK